MRWSSLTVSLARHTAVDHELANVQSSDFQVIHYQGAYSTALQREHTNGETSDGKRTDSSGTEGESSQRNGADRRRAARARRTAIRNVSRSRCLNRSRALIVLLDLVHVAPRRPVGWRCRRSRRSASEPPDPTPDPQFSLMLACDNSSLIRHASYVSAETPRRLWVSCGLE
jgi:hypothetical protein